MHACTADPRPLRATVVALSAALALAVLGATPAHAHAVLTGTQPERGATVTESLDAIVLEFNEAVAFPQVQVTGPDGERVEEGLPVEGGVTVEQPLAPVLEHGTYTVAFRVTSDDGHPVEGAFEFAYAGPVGTGGPDDPPPATSEAPQDDGSADDPEVVEEEPAIDDAPGPDPEETGDVDLGVPVLVVALLALLGLAGAAVVAVRRRGGGEDAPDGGSPDEAA